MPERRLKLGFVPLLDCAPLVVAREQGFFRQQGLNVTLCRESSWSSIRDKVSYGLLDGAQMLAPMPFAASLGLGAKAAPMLSALSLSRNGNAITCSHPLYQQLRQHGDATDPLAMGQALKQLLPRLPRKPVFATVYPYSNHHYQLRHWLSNFGIDPDNDIELVAISPSRMIDALETAEVDGYCVGEPWNSLAVLRGSGLILATGPQLGIGVAEKLFAVTQAWANQNPQTHLGLIRALLQACYWIAEQEDKSALLELLALPPYLDRTLLPLLDSGYPSHWGLAPLHQQFLLPEANRPQHSQGQWILQQMQQAGQLPKELATEQLVGEVLRPDLYDQALSGS